MADDGSQTSPDPQDRLVALYGERSGSELNQHLPELAERLVSDSALALIVVDARPLAAIERRFLASDAPLRAQLERRGGGAAATLEAGGVHGFARAGSGSGD